MKHPNGEPNRYEIYLVTAPGRWYVGLTTVGAQKRFREHLSGHGNPTVHALKDSCVLTILESGNGDGSEAEKRWYDIFLARGDGRTMNARRPGAYPPHTPEGDARLAAALRGRKKTDQHRANLSAAKKGKPASPAQREAASRSSAIARKTHCKNGHAFTPENTRIRSNGNRGCIKCLNAAVRRSYAKKVKSTGRIVGDPIPMRAHCPQGHPYSGPNLYVQPNGGRKCRICMSDAHRRYRKARREG